MNRSCIRNSISAMVNYLPSRCGTDGWAVGIECAARAQCIKIEASIPTGNAMGVRGGYVVGR